MPKLNELSEQQMNALLDAKLQQSREEGDRGLGDTIARLTSSIGIGPCGQCKKRQEKLNRLFPYRR